MDFHLFRFSIWILTLILSFKIDGTQSSTNSQEYYLQTYEIIDYGLSVFKTIIFYHANNGEFFDMMWNIRMNTSNIRHLMNTEPSIFRDMYPYEQQSGLDYLIAVLEYIDHEYNEFEAFYEIMDDQRGNFSSHIIEIYETGLLNVHAHLSLTWSNITHPMDNPGLFEAIVDHYIPQVGSNINGFQSLNQFIYNLCNKMLLGIIKIYSMVMFSTVKKTNDLSAPAINAIIDSFEMYILKVTGQAFEAMKRSSRKIYQYDPLVHKKGITYESLDYFLQDYVTDQKYLRQDGMCTRMCSVYDDTIHHDHNDSHLFLQNSICTGRIRSCMETEVNRMCLAPLDSTRRYEGLMNIKSIWEWFGHSQYWGRRSNHCDYFTASNISLSEPHCRVCSCTCDMIDSPKSIRYVDLQPRWSRASESYGITGIRFRIIDRIIYIQIQEGELRDGQIIAETVAWKEIENIDRDHDNDFELFKLDYNNRLFDLTDLTLPKNYAITMVGFHVMKGVVGLQIEGHPIKNGKFVDSIYHSIFNHSARTVSSRPVFQPDGFDVPTLEHNSNYKFSEPNKYLLKFQTSDWANDAGQNVVPFIDLQDAVTNPPEPLSGIGMHVRYGDKSGGFLALKLISISNEINVVHTNIKKKISPLRDVVKEEAESQARMTHMREALHQANLAYRPQLHGAIDIVINDSYIPSRG